MEAGSGEGFLKLHPAQYLPGFIEVRAEAQIVKQERIVRRTLQVQQTLVSCCTVGSPAAPCANPSGAVSAKSTARPTLMTLGAPGKKVSTSPQPTGDILSGVSPMLAPAPPLAATRSCAAAGETAL